MTKKISPEWSKIAEMWLGRADGKHCHWCKYSEPREDGMIRVCLLDGKRRRSTCPPCHRFKLDDWYTSDDNVWYLIEEECKQNKG